MGYTYMKFATLNQDGDYQVFLVLSSTEVGKGLLHFLKYEVSNYYNGHVWMHMETEDTLLMEFSRAQLLKALEMYISHGINDGSCYLLRYAADSLKRAWLTKQSLDTKIFIKLLSNYIHEEAMDSW